MGRHPLALQRIADGGRPAALPHDRIGDGSPRIPVPDQRRLALVCNPYRLDLTWGHSRLPQQLVYNVQARVEYLLGRVLDPAGRGVYLCNLPADPAEDPAEAVQEKRRRPRRALIDSEDIAGLCHPLFSFEAYPTPLLRHDSGDCVNDWSPEVNDWHATSRCCAALPHGPAFHRTSGFLRSREVRMAHPLGYDAVREREGE